VRHHPEAPGDLHLGQAAAAPTYGELQVASENPPINSEFEAGGGEALQPPAPSCPQTAPTATADGVVGVHLQQFSPDTKIFISHYRLVLKPTFILPFGLEAKFILPFGLGPDFILPFPAAAEENLGFMLAISTL
jgi:hypothetical protein